MRKQRKKKKRYHTGIHISSKALSECKYRSSWELAYMLYLDSCSNVKQYHYEPFKLPYVSNVRTKKIRNYTPDILVTYEAGDQELIEIKPSKRLAQAMVKKKLEAARIWCLEHQVTLKVITELELKKLKLIK